MFLVVPVANDALSRVAVMNLDNKTAYRGYTNDLEGGTADMLC